MLMLTQIETEKALLENLPQPVKFVILLALAAGVFFAYKHFTDGYEKVEGEWVAKPAYKQQIEEKANAFEECTVYELRVLSDGYYECQHCPTKTFFLKKDEVWKIGRTCDDDARYDPSYYRKKNVRYVWVFSGTVQQCQIEEVRWIAAYALYPENIQRPDPTEETMLNSWYKLLYPPNNTGLR